jgi:hypothetical protein
VLAYTVAIRPRNLIFARDTDFSATKPTQGMWMNFRLVILANKLRDFALALELLTWGFFSAGVIVLIVAFFP